LGLPASELEALAWTQPKVIEHTEGKDRVKVIVVPDKLVNIVVKG
jgi:leucyl-tRNA synthetase